MTTIQLRWHHLQEAVIQGEFSGQLPLRIGRAAENDLVLQDSLKSVSRHHARLLLEDGEIVVRDVGSMNGVYVNGRSTLQAPLRHNTELIIGAYTLTVLINPHIPKCSNPDCSREIGLDEPMCQWAAITPPDTPTENAPELETAVYQVNNNDDGDSNNNRRGTNPNGSNGGNGVNDNSRTPRNGNPPPSPGN